MQSTALLDALTRLRASTDVIDRPVRLVQEAFVHVPDPRRRQGQRYPLPFLLCVLVLAVLGNCDSLDAVGQWCQEHEAFLATHFPGQRFYTPTGSLFRRLLPRLCVASVEAVLAVWTLESAAPAPAEAIAYDGKTVRGAAGGDDASVHLLSFVTHESQETLLQVAVEGKTNEIPVARAVFPALPLAGRVLTADALHTCAETAQALLDQEADYLLVLKRNQPTLYDECAAYFSDPSARVVRATTVDRARGRTETRTLYATTRLNTHLMRYSRFPCIRQVACLRTVMGDRDGPHEDVRFLLTSLSSGEADPERLLALARGHWRIETHHQVRDVTFHEDRSRLRTGSSPQILAAVRNLACTMIRRSGASAIAATRRRLAYHPDQALALF